MVFKDISDAETKNVGSFVFDTKVLIIQVQVSEISSKFFYEGDFRKIIFPGNDRHENLVRLSKMFQKA